MSTHDGYAIKREYSEAFDEIRLRCLACTFRQSCAAEVMRDPYNLIWGNVLFEFNPCSHARQEASLAGGSPEDFKRGACLRRSMVRPERSSIKGGTAKRGGYAGRVPAGVLDAVPASANLLQLH
jgi:hypothetical protein